MYAYMTNGTLDLLMKINEKHPDLHLYYMARNDITTAYYESEQATVFETAREYEVIISTGALQEEGFVVMNNIPVTDEGRPIFETQFKQRAGMIDGTPGFHALRVLRPMHGNTYIVMVQWQDNKSYQAWKNSESFAKSHQTDKKDKSKKRPPYAAGPSYVTEFHMVDLDE